MQRVGDEGIMKGEYVVESICGMLKYEWRKMEKAWLRFRYCRRMPEYSRLNAAVLSARVNGAAYTGDALNENHWQWPQGTWLQGRIDQVRNDRKP